MTTEKMEMKTCSKCEQTKPVSKFHKNSQNPDGYHRYCKACRGTVTPRDERERKPLPEDVTVWLHEMSLIEPCIGCGGTIITPLLISVEEARQWYLTTAPKCRMCMVQKPSLKMRLREKRWQERAEDVCATVDLHHDLTLMLESTEALRRYTGADRWLAGHRTDISDRMIDLLYEQFEQRTDVKVIHDLNQRIPYHTLRRMRLNREREIVESRLGGDPEGDSMLDVVSVGND